MSLTPTTSPHLLQFSTSVDALFCYCPLLDHSVLRSPHCSARSFIPPEPCLFLCYAALPICGPLGCRQSCCRVLRNDGARCSPVTACFSCPFCVCFCRETGDGCGYAMCCAICYRTMRGKMGGRAGCGLRRRVRLVCEPFVTLACMLPVDGLFESPANSSGL